MMAATAKFRDDIAGAVVTTGTSTSYQVTSYQDFDSLAHLNGYTFKAAITIIVTGFVGAVWLGVKAVLGK